MQLCVDATERMRYPSIFFVRVCCVLCVVIRTAQGLW
jgi:hypothetical protein